MKAIVNTQLFVVVVVGFFLAGIFFPEILSRARQVPNTESTIPIAIQSLVIRLFSFDEAMCKSGVLSDKQATTSWRSM